MYASLGDIIFEGLNSFNELSDTRETKYAQMPLISGKPTLQRTGDGLVEVKMAIKYHVNFCNPEEEYLKLNNARVKGEVMTFIYGTGFIEGDFVITTLERTINQTDKIGNFVEITVNIGLLEYAAGNSAAKQLEQDKKNAFAISSNRPLPANSQKQPENPALSVCQENQKAKYAADDIDQRGTKINKDVEAITNIDPDQQLIDRAQKFVDSTGVFITKANEQVGVSNNALGSINSLIVAHASITGEAPDLPAKITAVQTVLGNLSTQLTALGTLPSIIGDVTDAGTALTEMTNTLTLIKTLKDNTAALNDENAKLAKAVATKKVLT